MTDSWVSPWGRRKKAVTEAAPVTHLSVAEPFHVTEALAVDAMMDDQTIPIAHRIGLALDQARQASGLKQWKWLKQADINERTFVGWKSGDIALSFKSLERLLPYVGWTLTITDASGQIIVQAPASSSPADSAR